MLVAPFATATPTTSAALVETRTRPSTAATFPGRLIRAAVSLPRVTAPGRVMTILPDAASVGGGAAEPTSPRASDNRTESRRVRRMVLPGYEVMDGPRWRVPGTQVPEPATRTSRTTRGSPVPVLPSRPAQDHRRYLGARQHRDGLRTPGRHGRPASAG